MCHLDCNIQQARQNRKHKACQMSIAFSILKLNELKTLNIFLLISTIFGEYASFTNETCLKASADKLYYICFYVLAHEN